MRTRTVWPALILALLIAGTAYSSAFGQLLGSFTLTISPDTLTIMQGGSGQAFITVGSVNNFSAPVSMSFSDTPAGVSITFDNNPVTPPPDGTAPSTALFSVDTSVPAGTYQMTLIGSSGSEVQNYPFTLQITAQPSPGDFSITAAPQTVSASPGGSASAIITITSINGFASPVTLTSSGAPSGVTVNYSPQTVTPSPGGYGDSAVSVSVSNAVSQGYYAITLTGSGSGGVAAVVIEHSTNLGLTVSSPQDFTITVNPSSLNIRQGQSKTAKVTVNPTGGFNSLVGLSVGNAVPPGVQIVFSPNPTTPGTATMSINIGASSPIGTFSLQIVGTSGSLSHATPFTMTVSQGSQPSFSLSASYNSVTVAQGRSTTVIIIVSSVGGFVSPVSTYTSWVGLPPAGVTVTGPGTLTPPGGGSTSGPLTISATSSASIGPYVLTIVGTSGSLTNSVTITVTIISQGLTPDFSVSAAPTVISIVQGSSGSSVVTVLSQDGFSSPVALSVSWQGTSPSGVTFTLPSPVTPPANAATTSTLTVSAGQGASVGTFTLIVTGTNGPLINSTPVSVNISAASATSSSTTSTTSSLSSSSSSTTTSSAGPVCFIATATFGSGLAPQVQFLRNLRDGDIMHTYVGWNFMIAFNAWYYSFSPAVAHTITQHSSLQHVMRVVLYPLIAILRIGATPFDLFPPHSEFAAILSGLWITSLIGLTYLTLPLTALSYYCLKRKRNTNAIQRILAGTLALSLAAIAIAEATRVSPLMILATTTTALSTLFLTGLVSSAKLVQLIERLTR